MEIKGSLDINNSINASGSVSCSGAMTCSKVTTNNNNCIFTPSGIVTSVKDSNQLTYSDWSTSSGKATSTLHYTGVQANLAITVCRQGLWNTSTTKNVAVTVTFTFKNSSGTILATNGIPITMLKNSGGEIDEITLSGMVITQGTYYLEMTFINNLQQSETTVRPNSSLDLSSEIQASGTSSARTVAIGYADTVYAGQTVINCKGEANSNTYKVVLGADGVRHAHTTSSTSGWVHTSDRRDKSDFKIIEKSLKFINSLEPVTFVDNNRDKYIKHEEVDSRLGKIIDTFDEESYKKQILKGNRRIAGFIAQDVYKNLNNIYGTDNYASIVDYSRYDEPNSAEDRYSMRPTQLIPFLTGAIQELSSKLDAATNKINELENTISEMKNNQESLNS